MAEGFFEGGAFAGRSAGGLGAELAECGFLPGLKSRTTSLTFLESECLASAHRGRTSLREKFELKGSLSSKARAPPLAHKSASAASEVAPSFNSSESVAV